MSLWGNNDDANNAPKFAVAGGLGVAVNGETLYQNTTTSAYVTNIQLGTFGVDSTEQSVDSANTGAHAGWILRTEGTGGRAGRIFSETLVAMGSMSADQSSGNDDDTLPDA